MKSSVNSASVVVHQRHVGVETVRDGVVYLDLQRGLGQLGVGHGECAYRPTGRR